MNAVWEADTFFFMWVAYEDEGIRKEESIHNLGRRESD